MEWLNRLDDVLDSALRPRRPPATEPTGNESSSEDIADNQTNEDSVTGGGDRGAPPPEASSKDNNNWHEGFVQNNHRVVSTANRAANGTIRSIPSRSTQTTPSGGASALPSRAPGRLKRIPARPRPHAANNTTTTATTANDDEEHVPVSSLPNESSDTNKSVQKIESQHDPSDEDKSVAISSPADEQPVASEPDLPATRHGGALSGASESEKNARPARSGEMSPPKAHESGVLSTASGGDDDSTPKAVQSDGRDINSEIEEHSNSREGHVSDLQSQGLLRTDLPDEFDSKDAEARLPSVPKDQSIRTDNEVIKPLTEQYKEYTSYTTSLGYEPTLLDTEADVVASSDQKRRSELQARVESEQIGECEPDSTGEPEALEETLLLGNNNGIESGDDRVQPRGTESVVGDTKSLRREAAKAPKKGSASTTPMSPVVEETNPVSIRVQGSQGMPFLDQTDNKYQPSKARSVGVPSTQKFGPDSAKSPSETEDVSVISDTQTFPQQVVFRSDFDVDHAAREWEEFPTDGPPFDPRMNCFGVVHVRVLRAQRLPCPVGSSVQAVVSLPPWKGRIRTRRTRAFAGSRRRGVCTDWSEGESAISMVHAYSSDESPIPSIKVEIVFSTLGMFEFKMCSLNLPCEILLRQPMVPRRQWFETVPDSRESTENIPLVQVEAMFESEEKTNAPDSSAPMEVVEVRRRSSTDDASMLESTSSVLASVAASTIQTRQPPSRQPSFSDRSLQPVLETRYSNEETPGEAMNPPNPPQHTSQQQEEAATSGDKSDLSVSLASYKKNTSAFSTKGHLLRTKTFYTPTWCAVCGGSIMSGIWRVPSFRCEECGIDCCSDCRLQVDVQLPCGSEGARKAAEEAAESQFTADKLLRWVAPVEESISNLTHGAHGASSDSPSARLDDDELGIGKIKLNFLQAFVLRNPLPPDASLDLDPAVATLKQGDYYMRVARADTVKTARTRTVQRATRPHFDSTEIAVSVPHYYSEFRLELVDAADDSPVGFVYMTAQMLLQEQRDDAVKQSLLPLPQLSFRKRRIVRELRRFVKSGVAGEYFPSAGTKSSGEVVGMVEFQVVLDEDFRALYGGSPYACPPRPKDELDLAKFKSHIGRISQVISDVRSAIHMVGYVVSWENPYLTGISLLVFVKFCYQVHPDHFFTGPAFLCILYMAYLAFLRTSDGLKHKYLEKEMLTHRKSSVAPEYLALHRPVGLLKTIVGGGKNIRSPEMGLPGNVSCRVSIDLARYCDEKDRKVLSAIDAAVEAPHLVGSTEQTYSTSPKWKFLEESDEAKRLQHVVPSQDGFFDAAGQNVTELDFPILQPISRNPKTKELELRPWSDSKAALVFEVIFHDFAAILPGSEYSLGEVVVPVSDIVENGELSGWYKISHHPSSKFFAVSPSHSEEERPAISVGMRWVAPAKVEGLPADVEREASIVMQEELSRSVKLGRKKTVGLVGSSLGAINTVRGISGYILAIQNGLGSLLDTIEAAQSLVNFSDPLKSSMVVAILVLLWLILYTVPLRLLVFTMGMVPYSVSLKARYDRLVRKGGKPTDPASNDDKRSNKRIPFATWVNNFTRSLPIDDDMRKTYFWETRRAVAKKLRKEAEERRTSRLRKLWRAQWYEAVEVLRGEKGKDIPELKRSFAVILGRRFMWWGSVDDFDNGEQPIGKIFLQGHAGLATLSPIEQKAIGKNTFRAVSIFGKGSKDQERVTMLVSGEQSKDRFEKAVMAALYTKDD